jgi:ADP-ribose pyrophosphatase YjhB (NUDIX family)
MENNAYNSSIQNEKEEIEPYYVPDISEFIQLTDRDIQWYYKAMDDNKTIQSGLAKPYNEQDKKRYRNVYCVNCGEKGHVVKDCMGPITSFGIIAFKVVHNQEQEMEDTNDGLQKIIETLQLNPSTTYPKIKFLLIQRKDTMGYIDFVRGKYPENNPDAKLKLLHTCLEEMTKQEKNNLLTQLFDTIWSNLWINHNSKTFKNEYHSAKTKYEKLDIKKLVQNSTTQFEWPEFGFPKGRRNMRETNISCAEREFLEETGYSKSHYDFIKDYPTIHEEFVGTNGVRYRHIYYLVKMKEDAPPPRIDHTNIVQTGEVQNIGWFTHEESMALIRPYDSAKKSVIDKVYHDIVSMKHQYNTSSFYYASRKNNNFMPNWNKAHWSFKRNSHDCFV